MSVGATLASGGMMIYLFVEQSVTGDEKSVTEDDKSVTGFDISVFLIILESFLISDLVDHV